MDILLIAALGALSSGYTWEVQVTNPVTQESETVTLATVRRWQRGGLSCEVAPGGVRHENGLVTQTVTITCEAGAAVASAVGMCVRTDDAQARALADGDTMLTFGALAETPPATIVLQARCVGPAPSPSAPPRAPARPGPQRPGAPGEVIPG